MKWREEVKSHIREFKRRSGRVYLFLAKLSAVLVIVLNGISAFLPLADESTPTLRWTTTPPTSIRQTAPPKADIALIPLISSLLAASSAIIAAISLVLPFEAWTEHSRLRAASFRTLLKEHDSLSTNQFGASPTELNKQWKIWSNKYEHELRFLDAL
eukprot:scaffold234829_cov36-Prasinocladus_malaysianus.AAC.1